MRWSGLLPVLGLAATAFSGCLTINLVKPRRLPPRAYGTFLGMQPNGPGQDRFIYYLERHTGARPGYYAVQPAAAPGSGPPVVDRLGPGDPVPRTELVAVPVLEVARTSAGDPGPSAGRPAVRIVRLPDQLGREVHAYERWAPDDRRWRRLGACAMGTRKYKSRPGWLLIFLPFTFAIDAATAPFQVIGLLIYAIARDVVRNLPRAIGRAAADAATTAVIGHLEHRLR